MLSRIHFFMLDPLSSEEFKHSCIGQSFERDIESGAVKYFPVSKKDQCLVVGSHTRPPARKPHANLERGIRVRRESERDDRGSVARTLSFGERLVRLTASGPGVCFCSTGWHSRYFLRAPLCCAVRTIFGNGDLPILSRD